MIRRLLLCFNTRAKRLYNKDLQKNINIEVQSKKFLAYYRLGSLTNNTIVKLFCRLILRKIRLRYGIEIGLSNQIGHGFYLGHAYNITINPAAILGNNVSVHKGVLIGSSNRGNLKGSPIIGSNVWIGCNAAVVGKIIIGDDVLIAPNSYVNRDIPSHSVVFGNPCVIKHKMNATEGYVKIIN